MSAQFGRWNIDSRPGDPDFLARADRMLALYGPDGGQTYIKDSVGILYRAFHTTQESRREIQPYVTASTAVLTWDGRLDNRGELLKGLSSVSTGSTDVAVVGAAYDAWGISCFSKLIGDWALSIWDPRNRSLILAKDPIGTRHLYYSCEEDQITWSTTLDPLVLLADRRFKLEEEYIAGWLSFFPETHLTPYSGIYAVPPSCFVHLGPRGRRTSEYWDFDPSERIRHRMDSEYEERFRQVFGEAVRRRLRSDRPVLAELSGGLDSSSIVCMADEIIARGEAETPQLDTLSYYDDSEPNWNERPYFTKVEEKRGRPGCHIDVSSHGSFVFDFESGTFAATPACSGGGRSESSLQFAAALTSRESRVVLSGIGGDEITGGVPTPTPELEDLIATMRVGALARQLKAWALNKRKPWFHLLFEAVGGFLPPTLAGVPKHRRPAAWLCPQFVQRHWAALTGYEPRLKLFGPLPSFQENLIALKALRRQLACEIQPSDPCYEKRYPYLDRDLIAFVYAIPRQQLVRPGQRRSLMRRALSGIVPHELLNRKRKAFVARGPRLALAELTTFLRPVQHMISASIEIVNPREFLMCVQKARQDPEVSVLTIMRTVSLELWLRSLSNHSLLEIAYGARPCATDSRKQILISAEKN